MAKKQSRVIKDLKDKRDLTYKDFINGEENSIAFKVYTIMSVHRYEFKVKRALYKNGDISADTYLFTNDVYRHLGYKNKEGNIILNDIVLQAVKRKELADELHNQEQFLFSLLVDLDDEFYALIEKSTEEEMDKTFKSNIQDAIQRIVRISLDATLMEDINTIPEVAAALEKKNK